MTVILFQLQFFQFLVVWNSVMLKMFTKKKHLNYNSRDDTAGVINDVDADVKGRIIRIVP